MSHRLETLDETLIAPQEMRELIARLTESAVEGVPLDQPRTLAAFASETGIPIEQLRRTLGDMRTHPRWQLPVAIGLALVFVAVLATSLHRSATPPAPISQPPVVTTIPQPTYDETGLVAISQVTYGPDTTNSKVDPSFSPTKPIQPGLSISATVGPIMWGSGDHRAAALHEPLNSEQAADLRKSIEELLQYVRKHALRRKLPIAAAPVQTTGFGYDGKGYTVAVGVYSYGGFASTMVVLPPAGTDDAVAGPLIERFAAKTVDDLQKLLRWRQDSDSSGIGR